MDLTQAGGCATFLFALVNGVEGWKRLAKPRAPRGCETRHPKLIVCHLR